MNIAIIGGGFFWERWGARHEEINICTPYGKTADAICAGRLGEHNVYTLQRHGKTYEHTLDAIPWQANIYGLGMQKPDIAIQITASGSLRDDDQCGDLVLFDQLIDWTKNRPVSLGLNVLEKVTYLNFAQPVSPELIELAGGIFNSKNIKHKVGGIMLTEEGPRYSTLAESRMYKKLGADFINQSSCPELYFFRELNIPTLAITMVTNRVELENGGDIEAEEITHSIARFKHVMPDALKVLIENLPAHISLKEMTAQPYNTEQFTLRAETDNYIESKEDEELGVLA